MNDFRPRLPELSPLPGQVEEALRAVRRRRRRSLSTAASCAGAAVVTALLVTSHGPGSAVLDQTDEGVAQTATAVPSPTGHGRETDSATGPRFATPGGGVAPVLRAGEAGVAMPSAQPTGPPGAEPSGEAGAVSPSPTMSARPRPAITRQRFSNLDPGQVGDRTGSECGPGAGGSCSAAGSTARVDGAEMTVKICALSEPYELRFAGEQEADLVVRDGKGREVWRWSRGQLFTNEAHTIALAPQECVMWTVPWDYGDESGTRVPSGYYTALLPILSDPRHDMGTTVRVPPPRRT